MDTQNVEVPAKFKDIVASVETMTVIELHELVKLLEAKWGVSAAAVAAAGPAAGPAVEEKDAFTVILTAVGEARISWTMFQQL